MGDLNIRFSFHSDKEMITFNTLKELEGTEYFSNVSKKYSILESQLKVTAAKYYLMKRTNLPVDRYNIKVRKKA
ncbi:hypothetical protein ACFPU1_12825 [Thalassorhabdus alkalitolerans]|uniref:Uncharacterized protein n=1 Tax=Thalassorhabdus alkalitolerans TaxID=2282697 RepID=A0ABW0YSX4_9BACI